jgi:hypothetical protein
MGRPATSTRLKSGDCTALHVSQLPDLESPGYRLARDIRDITGTVHGGTVPFRLRAELVRGSRGWRFLCPRCGRPARTLYFPPNSAETGCRICLRLVYSSQYRYWTYEKGWQWYIASLGLPEDQRQEFALQFLSKRSRERIRNSKRIARNTDSSSTST